MKKEESFTLIELLVVIAIIGLLSAIVIVNLMGSRERAKVASGMQFSDTLRASLSDAVVSWWSFNEGSGNTVGDTWGGNTGTINGASWIKGVAGDALIFDGSNDYVQVPNNPSLNFSATESFTIEIWIKTSKGDTTQRIVSKFSLGDGYLFWVYYYGPSPGWCNRVKFLVKTGGSYGDALGTTVVTDGRWHHVVGVRDTTTHLVRLYVDGEEDARSYDSSSSLETPAPFYIGNLLPDNQPFHGIIDEVRVYNRALTALEIQKRYAQGLKKFKLAEK